MQSNHSYISLYLSSSYFLIITNIFLMLPVIVSARILTIFLLWLQFINLAINILMAALSYLSKKPS